VTVLLTDFETIEEHAEHFNRSTRTLERWVREPDGLPHTWAGRMRLFRPQWTAEWLASRKTQRNPPYQKRGPKPRGLPRKSAEARSGP
jgi:hypothetical protein